MSFVIHNVIHRLSNEFPEIAREIRKSEGDLIEYVSYWAEEVRQLLPNLIGEPDEDDINGRRMFDKLVEVETLKAIIGPRRAAEANLGGIT